MTHNANHVTDHNELRALVATELSRFGLGNTLGGPWNPGDPDHVGRHNAMVDALAAVATAAGRTYTAPLPPHRALGQTGHIGDHDAMRAAVVEAATWPAWNSATGGTVADIPNYNGTGKTWRTHTFTSNGTFTVSQGTQTFRVLVVGGGGGGGGQNGNRHGGGGSGGFWVHGVRALAAGTHAVTIGAGGARAHYEWESFPGQPTTLGSITANGGPGGTPLSDNSGATNGGTSDITGTSQSYGQGAPPNQYWAQVDATPNTGNGGGGGGSNSFPGLAGGSGIVVVAYQIG